MLRNWPTRRTLGDYRPVVTVGDERRSSSGLPVTPTPEVLLRVDVGVEISGQPDPADAEDADQRPRRGAPSCAVSRGIDQPSCRARAKSELQRLVTVVGVDADQTARAGVGQECFEQERCRRTCCRGVAGKHQEDVFGVTRRVGEAGS